MVFFLNLFSQLPDFSAGRQAAVYKDADPVADLLNLIELVRRNQKSSAILPGKLQHKLQQLPHAFRVDAQGRLVHDDNLRILHQHIGDSQTLLHAFGVGSGPLVGGIGHADTCQQRFCTRFRFIAAKTIELPCKKKVLPSGHIGIKANIIWQIADGPLDFYSFSGAVKTQNGSIA